MKIELERQRLIEIDEGTFRYFNKNIDTGFSLAIDQLRKVEFHCYFKDKTIFEKLFDFLIYRSHAYETYNQEDIRLPNELTIWYKHPNYVRWQKKSLKSNCLTKELTEKIKREIKRVNRNLEV